VRARQVAERKSEGKRGRVRERKRERERERGGERERERKKCTETRVHEDRRRALLKCRTNRRTSRWRGERTRDVTRLHERVHAKRFL